MSDFPGGGVVESRTVKIQWAVGQIIRVEDCDYGDELPKEPVYDLNGLFQGVKTGEYKPNCKITVGKKDFDMINIAAAAKGGLYNLGVFPLVVTYMTVPPSKHDLNIILTKVGHSIKKGDEVTVSIETVVCGPIIRDGVPAYTTI